MLMKKNIILTILSILLLQNTVFANVIKFAQVTDSHFIAKNEYRTEVLQETINSINKEKDISFVVFTGDNLDSPKEQYLPDFVKIINKLNVPYYIVIGNHDVFKQNGLSKAHYLEIIKDYNYFYKYKEPNYVFKQNGFVFIVLDGAKEVIPGSNGFYKENTLSWLDKQLKKYKNDPVIIFQHFPIVMTKERPTHTVYQKDKYLDILDKHDNVISIIAGHLHINDEVMRNGVYHITSPTLLSTPPVYKIITVSTTKGFSPMIYTELKEVEMPKSQE